MGVCIFAYFSNYISVPKCTDPILFDTRAGAPRISECRSHTPISAKITKQTKANYHHKATGHQYMFACGITCFVKEQSSKSLNLP